jgi:hypothetical protein
MALDARKSDEKKLDWVSLEFGGRKSLQRLSYVSY